MSLNAPEEMTTTDLNTVMTTYTAGEEPWNKNLEGFMIDSIETQTGHYQTDWRKWHGLYREIAELRSTIDVWCNWVIGKKITMSKSDEKKVKRWTGNGKDTFRKLLLNLKRTSKICGDAYGEIIVDNQGRTINLKPLNPGTIKIRSSDRGRLIQYEEVQINNSGEEKPIILNTWKPDEIFHLINSRIADEIHGIPEIEKVLKIIKWKHQAMSDNSVIIHRYGKPTYFFEVDTDDAAEVAAIKVEINKAFKDFENVITPKGVLTEVKRVSTPQFGTIDMLPWLNFLSSTYTEASNVPDLIRGKSVEVSLAAGKLNYLGYKEKIIQEQIDFSEDIENQLGIKVTFEEPTEIDIEIARESSPAENTSNKDKQDAKRETTVTSGRDPNKSQS